MSWVVVLFKAPNSSSETSGDDKFLTHLRRLEEGGQLVSKVGVVPVLDFEFCELEVLWMALREDHKYDGLILTSPRCVESIQRCIQMSIENKMEWNVSLKVNWASKRVFCVGPATLASVLELFDIPSADTPSNIICSGIATSEALAMAILGETGKVPIALPLLYPSRNLKTETLSDTLATNDVPFRPITTYRTVQNSMLALTLKLLIETAGGQQDELGSKRMLCIFFSPSGINVTMPYLSQLDQKHFIAIGPTTRAALEKVPGIDPLKIHQCSNPTPEALNQLVIDILLKG